MFCFARSNPFCPEKYILKLIRLIVKMEQCHRNLKWLFSAPNSSQTFLMQSTLNYCTGMSFRRNNVMIISKTPIIDQFKFGYMFLKEGSLLLQRLNYFDFIHLLPPVHLWVTQIATVPYGSSCRSCSTGEHT